MIESVNEDFATSVKRTPDEFKFVKLRCDGGVARMTMSRPEHNLLNEAMLREMADGISYAGERDDVKLIVLPLESGIVEKVVDDLPCRRPLPGDIGRRIELVDDIPADGVVAGSGNAVGGKRLLRERIVNDAAQLREIACPHQVCGDAGGEGQGIAHAPSLVIHEEEGFVVPDGASQRPAKLVLAKSGLGAAKLVVEQIISVELVIA